MARYTGPSCRLCRRERLKLFLKGERCYSEKCAVDRREYPPGQHGQSRKRYSDYDVQLREKQKVKRIYGVMEQQFRGYFEEANRQKGITGENLLLILERRLDNMVYRMGFASSRNEARQLIRHNHFEVNGKRVNIPSYLMRAGDVIELKEKSRKIAKVQESLEGSSRRGVPRWLEVDKDNLKGKVVALPAREELTMPINEQIIVEFYSK
ncbi:MAG: 30S ribosomal protein S4 [Proteobacteria bacterium]|nr:30S ribosomal protein S4 [Pseudomonadota bacterium]HUT83667.1 30S ribosomal protein S4 [Thermodesulfobacteriota bacterium]